MLYYEDLLKTISIFVFEVDEDYSLLISVNDCKPFKTPILWDGDVPYFTWNNNRFYMNSFMEV